eukprot:scaffold186890_cov30-Tisochrysis_lutea.AAC.1
MWDTRVASCAVRCAGDKACVRAAALGRGLAVHNEEAAWFAQLLGRSRAQPAYSGVFRCRYRKQPSSRANCWC